MTDYFSGGSQQYEEIIKGMEDVKAVVEESYEDGFLDEDIALRLDKLGVYPFQCGSRLEEEELSGEEALERVDRRLHFLARTGLQDARVQEAKKEPMEGRIVVEAEIDLLGKREGEIVFEGHLGEDYSLQGLLNT